MPGEVVGKTETDIVGNAARRWKRVDGIWSGGIRGGTSNVQTKAAYEAYWEWAVKPALRSPASNAAIFQALWNAEEEAQATHPGWYAMRVDVAYKTDKTYQALLNCWDQASRFDLEPLRLAAQAKCVFESPNDINPASVGKVSAQGLPYVDRLPTPQGVKPPSKGSSGAANDDEPSTLQIVAIAAVVGVVGIAAFKLLFR